ncbi:hypothetical protein EBT31_12330 [bacterium]|jgi:hypothetical protein|nr:hypothetical protein [bacterium]NBX50444.1 hypothetical protein [bacterium]
MHRRRLGVPAVKWFSFFFLQKGVQYSGFQKSTTYSWMKVNQNIMEQGKFDHGSELTATQYQSLM